MEQKKPVNNRKKTGSPLRFKKGQSGNPSGRKPGRKNKLTREIRSLIAGFLDNNFEQVQKDFKRLGPSGRVKAYTRLLPYVVPRLTSTSLDIKIEDLTTDQLDILIEKLKKNEGIG